MDSVDKSVFFAMTRYSLLYWYYNGFFSEKNITVNRLINGYYLNINR